MATDFNSIGPPQIVGFALKKRFRSLLVPLTSLNLIGLAATPTKITLNFDLIPLLTGLSTLVSNWVITGATPTTVNTVTIVGNTIELGITSSFEESTYVLIIPAGLSTDSGFEGFPFPYAGPTQVSFAVTAVAVLDLVSTVGTLNTVTLTFSETLGVLPAVESNPSNWVITGPTPVTVTNVTSAGATIILTTNELQNGGIYNVVIPGGFRGVSDSAYAGPISANFTGVAAAPIATQVTPVTATLLRLVFSEAVNENDALDPANYSVAPPLQVLSVQKETQSIYLLTTAPQDANVLYTLTVSNIRDLAGNII